ncbi:hypothetical protein ACLMJK_004598 [Lecanora helva]
MTTSSQDAIHARLNVHLAQNARFVSSWPSLKHNRKPSTTASTSKPTEKSQEALEKEEDEIFTPVPELLGFGASLPKDGIDVPRENLSSNEKLRKQLLGKDYAKKLGKSGRNSGEPASAPALKGSRLRPPDLKRKMESDSEDDGGRSSLGTSMKRRKKSIVRPDHKAVDEDTEVAPRDQENGVSEPRSQKKTSNYLDEVLAERSLQKRKKSKKKKKARSPAR